MASFTVNIKFLNSQKESIYIPYHLISKLNIKNKSVTPLYFGINKVRFPKVRGIKTDKNDIYITSKLKETLLFPYSKKVLIKKEQEGIRLGPIIGILTTDYTGKKFSSIQLGKEHPFSLFFKNMLEPEPFYPAFYFIFTPENIDFTTNTVKGFFYSSHNHWEPLVIPFPDVVYNRIPNRTIERGEVINYFKKQYLNKGGKLFNFSFFNKWDIYNILVKNEKTKEFIPETYLGPSANLFTEMLNKYPIIYLKPANGSLGLGIYKIIKDNSGHKVQFRLKNQNRSLIYKNPAILYKYIFTNKLYNRYLLQQGINLIEYQQNPVDFRVHLHKTYSNEWKVIAVGAKVAGRGSVTTHLRTGGQLINANQFLDQIFKDKAVTMKNKIIDSAILIAKVLENELNLPLGELGLDIGIDQDQKIWLFEVNSKPGRSIFKHPSLKSVKMESNKLLIEYAIFLSGF